MSAPAPAAAGTPRRPARAAAAVALAAGLTFAAAGAPLLVALGTAQERLVFGRDTAPACSFRARTGRPCLGCGGTRALHLAARGDWRGAVRANPLGAWAALMAWLVAGAGAAGLVSGSGAWLKRAAFTVLASAPLAFVFTFVWWWHALPPGPGGP